MGRYIINGGKTLSGELEISGAKNAVLPILAATVLNNGVTILKNVPMLTDTFVAIDILKHLGACVSIEKSDVIIDTSSINKTEIPNELVKKMRSSIIFLGSLISRFKKAKVSYPGGCKLGKRAIDFHLSAFETLNIQIKDQNTFINAYTKEIKGSEISLPFASVGATQNIMLAAVLSKGKTILNNAAKEPEIAELQDFLNKMGADITGAGTEQITINGVEKLKDIVEHTVMPDRIEAGTFLCAAAATGSKLKLKNVVPRHLESLIITLVKMGCIIKQEADSISIISPKELRPISNIKTGPYPMFPTDLQPQIMSVLTLANGTSIIEEKVFEARNKHIAELNKMGANINENGTTFTINGVKQLSQSLVDAKDLRGGASLIIAALAAKGETVVDGAKYVKRGYEEIEKKLNSIGADIKYIKD